MPERNLTDRRPRCRMRVLPRVVMNVAGDRSGQSSNHTTRRKRTPARPMVCAGVFAIAAVVLAQDQAQPPAVRTTRAGVLIDATVVDRKRQPVLDLRPDEFELTEEGTRQQILSVTLVHGGVARAAGPLPPAPIEEPAPASGTAGSATPEPADSTARVESSPSVTAILLDRLSPEARPLAHRAASEYASTLTPSDYAGRPPSSVG